MGELLADCIGQNPTNTPLERAHVRRGFIFKATPGLQIMKDGNWIPIDKRLACLLPHNREYTFVEAYISFRCDMDDNKDFTINGYAKLWSWSRNKVRNFIEGLRTGEGHSVDTQRTGKGQEIRLVFNTLEAPKDRRRTGKGQAKDTQEDTTINPNPNKKEYAENVRLTEDELKTFIEKYGPNFTKLCIDKLSAYKTSKGEKYKSDAGAIRSWVIGEISKHHRPDNEVIF